MFYYCSSLDMDETTARGYLSHITEITQQTCKAMFGYCTSLTTAPDLDSITSIGGASTDSCLLGMFLGCTKITAQPKMPIPTVYGSSVCEAMFSDCTSLGGAADIRVSGRLAAKSMFNGTKITSAVVKNGSVNIGEWVFQNVRTLQTLDVESLHWPMTISGNPAAPRVLFGNMDTLIIRGNYNPPDMSKTNLFDGGLKPTCMIYVHPDQYNNYIAASGWNSRSGYIRTLDELP